MEAWQREVYVNQIISGIEILTINGKEYTLREPTTEAKYRASLVYKEVYENCLEEKNFLSEEIISFMVDNGLWSSAEEKQLKKLNEDVPEIKVKIYQASLKTDERVAQKAYLREVKKEIERLTYKRHSMDYLTCAGVATSARIKFTIGCSLYLPNGRPYWKSYKNWQSSDELIDSVITALNESRLDETVIRELVRNEPWRSIWSASKRAGLGVFNKASIDLTDYQKNLIQFSQMYDNIYEAGELSDEVIEDDDMLDGWMILQRRERENELTKKSIEDKISDNPRIRNAEEIFIPVNNEEDAKKIYETMDIGGKMAFKSKMAQVKQEGVVKEQDMHHTRLQVQEQLSKQVSAHIKGN